MKTKIAILINYLVSTYGGVRLIHDLFNNPDSRIVKMVELVICFGFLFLTGYILGLLISNLNNEN